MVKKLIIYLQIPVLILLFISIVCFVLSTTNIYTVKYTKAIGIVERKVEIPYACGKYNRETCFRNEVLINGDYYFVTKDEYDLIPIGRYYSIYTYKKELPLLVQIFIYLLPLFIISYICILNRKNYLKAKYD